MKITNGDNMAVLVHKEPCDKNHPYCMINMEAAGKAVQNLSEDAFKLWCYFAKNPKGHNMVLSLDDAAKWGIKESSFYESMDELTKRKYISDLGRDVFIFYENPNSNF